MVTVRTIISIVAARGRPLSQIDVSNAFLKGDLYEEVYILLPQGFHKQGELQMCKGSLSGAKPVATPIELNKKLTTVEYDTCVGKTGDLELKDNLAYQRLIGRLFYLTITRPDISFAVQTLSQFMQRPEQSYMEAALRIVRYVKGAPDMGLLMEAGPIDHLTAYCDSDWASCLNTRKSMTGFIVKLGLLEDLGVKVSTLVTLFCDNKAAIQIVGNPIFHEQTKHIEIDCHFVGEKIKTGLVTPCHVSSSLQLANLLTKGLTTAQHSFLVSKLGVLDIFHPPA
uniref:Reverse transcriptase Ty1/copia-type domain-containing protein n=2 Tax=Nicotiana TaxID=4085 RepID=A0A1S4BX03_TOBAC|nr:PREDICTED: uncharacterized protein LOC104247766 [Nicotiana sylvestris]XP_016493432.1 PREDICTED: uncharacterized protein LOC107812777 [Nicotiana tabacum]